METRSERHERAARNELLFRTVNEHIVEITDGIGAGIRDLDIVCECADTSCTGTIQIATDVFAKVERNDGTFLVIPDHEDESVEQVVERHDKYVVVFKAAVAGGTAV